MTEVDYPNCPICGSDMVFPLKEQVICSECHEVHDAQDKEGHEGRWITMRGTHVFIRKGETPAAAIKRSIIGKAKERGKTPIKPEAKPEKKEKGYEEKSKLQQERHEQRSALEKQKQEGRMELQKRKEVERQARGQGKEKKPKKQTKWELSEGEENNVQKFIEKTGYDRETAERMLLGGSQGDEIKKGIEARVEKIKTLGEQIKSTHFNIGDLIDIIYQILKAAEQGRTLDAFTAFTKKHRELKNRKDIPRKQQEALLKEVESMAELIDEYRDHFNLNELHEDMFVDDSFAELVSWVINKGMTDDQEEAKIIAWKIINSRRKKAKERHEGAQRAQQERQSRRAEIVTALKELEESIASKIEQLKFSSAERLIDSMNALVAHFENEALKRAWNKRILEHIFEIDRAKEAAEHEQLQQELLNSIRSQLEGLKELVHPDNVEDEEDYEDIKNAIGNVMEAVDLLTNEQAKGIFNREVLDLAHKLEAIEAERRKKQELDAEIRMAAGTAISTLDQYYYNMEGEIQENDVEAVKLIMDAILGRIENEVTDPQLKEDLRREFDKYQDAINVANENRRAREREEAAELQRQAQLAQSSVAREATMETIRQRNADRNAARRLRRERAEAEAEAVRRQSEVDDRVARLLGAKFATFNNALQDGDVDKAQAMLGVIEEEMEKMSLSRQHDWEQRFRNAKFQFTDSFSSQFTEQLEKMSLSAKILMGKMPNNLAYNDKAQAKIDAMKEMANSLPFSASQEWRGKIKTLESTYSQKVQQQVSNARVSDTERRREREGLGQGERMNWERAPEAVSNMSPMVDGDPSPWNKSFENLPYSFTFGINHPTKKDSRGRPLTVCTARCSKKDWYNPMTNKTETTMYLGWLEADPAYAGGLGAGKAMGAELIKWADENQVTITGGAQPYDREDRRPTGLTHEQYNAAKKEEYNKLIDFYMSFGGIPYGERGYNASLNLVRFPRKKSEAGAWKTSSKTRNFKKWAKQAGYLLTRWDFLLKARYEILNPDYIISVMDITFYWATDGLYILDAGGKK